MASKGLRSSILALVTVAVLGMCDWMSSSDSSSNRSKGLKGSRKLQGEALVLFGTSEISGTGFTINDVASMIGSVPTTSVGVSFGATTSNSGAVTVSNNSARASTGGTGSGALAGMTLGDGSNYGNQDVRGSTSFAGIGTFNAVVTPSGIGRTGVDAASGGSTGVALTVKQPQISPSQYSYGFPEAAGNVKVNFGSNAVAENASAGAASGVNAGSANGAAAISAPYVASSYGVFDLSGVSSSSFANDVTASVDVSPPRDSTGLPGETLVLLGNSGISGTGVTINDTGEATMIPTPKTSVGVSFGATTSNSGAATVSKNNSARASTGGTGSGALAGMTLKSPSGYGNQDIRGSTSFAGIGTFNTVVTPSGIGPTGVNASSSGSTGVALTVEQDASSLSSYSGLPSAAGNIKVNFGSDAVAENVFGAASAVNAGSVNGAAALSNPYVASSYGTMDLSGVSSSSFANDVTASFDFSPPSDSFSLPTAMPLPSGFP